MFTLRDTVEKRVAGSLTGLGGSSKYTLTAQLAGDPQLLVPNSLNFNLILRLLPSGTDCQAVAVVACRLACRAPLE